jgi:hypothetical protein
LVSCLLLGASSARADSYEWERMQRVLQREGLEQAEQPEGKRIAWIRVVRDEVFVEDEIWPTWLNWFHATTREAVVRRELLFQADAPYVEARIEESMRNLRGMTIFALVRIVAVKVPEPGAVGVVVHTRDLWSLRAETAFDGSTIVDQFVGRLVERNFLGRNTALAVDVTWTPNNYRLGQEYIARRVLASTVQLQEAVGVVMNKDQNRAEGSTWETTLGQPFYNLRQRFSWKGSFSYATLVRRRMAKLEILPFPSRRTDLDGPHTQQVYRSRVGLGSLMGYLRLGERFKQTWGLGWDARSGRYSVNAETMLEPAQREAFFAAVLPRDRREIGPLFTYEILIPQFQKFVNLASYGVTENVRIGPYAGLTARAPLRAFGSDTNSWVFSTSVGYILVPAGWLMEAHVVGRTRYEKGQLADQRFEALVRGATPVLFDWLRLVARVTLDARRNDTAKTYVTLGASNGLRGYESQAFAGSGASRVLANLELRTMPIKWQAVQVGGVIFYDTGSVYTKVDSLRLHHAVGIGLRVLLPQLNRTPFSIDGARWTDPAYHSAYPIIPTIKDGQVVPLTAVEDPP